MSFLFGKKKTPQEILRENQRALNKSIREIDRERTALQRQEKKTETEIRKMAKQGQMAAARTLARDLVRTRNQVNRMYNMRSQLQAVSLRISTLKSTAQMSQAMAGVTRAMMTMNRQMNLPQMQRIMMEFEKQTELMDMKQEMMEDMMEDVMDEEDADEESEDVINQVLDEIGINLGSQLVDTPSNVAIANPQQNAPVAVAQGAGAGPGAPSGGSVPPPAAGGGASGAGGSDIDDLQARLDNLRK